MKMIHFKRALTGLALLLMAGPVAEAQDTKFFVGGGLMANLDSAKAITNKTMAFNIQGGMDFKFQEKLVFRPGFQVNFFPGAEKAGVKTSMRSYQVFGDFVYPTGLVDNLNFSFGLSVNRYLYDSTFADPSSFDPEFQWAPTDSYTQVYGTKLGFRVGVDYRIQRNFSVELLFQQTELGSPVGDDQHYANQNPAWIQVGARFHF